MPALPPVPGVVRIDFTQHAAQDLDIITRIYMAYTGTAPTDAQLDTFAGLCDSHWNGDLAAFANPVVSLVGVEVIDLSTPTSAIGADSTVRLGTRAGAPNAGGVALLVNHKIARRYRGGKPRSYWPFLNASDLTDEQTWDAATLASFDAAYASFITSIKGSVWVGGTLTGQVNVSYYEGFASVQNPVTMRWRNIATPRALPLVDAIVTSSANTKPGSQRRRNLHQLAEDFAGRSNGATDALALRRVYSTQFAAVGGITVPNNFGPVPAGHRWVVRDIDVYASTGASAMTGFAEINGVAFAFIKVSGFSQDGVQWRGRQVLMPGDVLTLNPAGQASDWCVSGYDLID